MFSLLFPGQGSQIVGMGKEFYENFNYVKELFNQADDLLNKKISKIILSGPKEELDQTENTQPAIFLVSYSIFKSIENETNLNLKNAKYFAGHSLGEYSALCCAGAINFKDTLLLLRDRGKAMQNAVPTGIGGMIAILGSEIEIIKNSLIENKDNFSCYIANDNSNGQVVVSGEITELKKFEIDLNKKQIKFVRLPVSAPFHCPLMKNATLDMRQKIINSNFTKPYVEIISNVSASSLNDPEKIKKLLIDQIEKPVRWRESIIKMINLNIDNFIEIGPGKVLSGLVKRIDRNVNINQVNNLQDLKKYENE